MRITIGKKEKIVLIVELVFLLISVTYVPWEGMAPVARIRASSGYGCVFSPPTANLNPTPEYGRVILTAIGVCIATGIAYLIVRKGNSK